MTEPIHSTVSRIESVLGIHGAAADMLRVATGSIARPTPEQNATMAGLRDIFTLKGDESRLFFEQLAQELGIVDFRYLLWHKDTMLHFPEHTILLDSGDEEASEIEWENDATREQFITGFDAITDAQYKELRELDAQGELDKNPAAKYELTRLILKGLGYMAFTSVDEVQQVMQGLQKEQTRKKVKIGIV